MGIDFTLERVWKVLFLTLVVAALGALLIGFLSFLGSAATSALSSFGAVTVLHIMPSNFTTVLGLILSIKMSGTVYVTAVNFIETKVSILT